MENQDGDQQVPPSTQNIDQPEGQIDAPPTETFNPLLVAPVAPEKKSKTALIIGIAVSAGIILLISAGLAVYFLVIKKDNPAPPTPSQNFSATKKPSEAIGTPTEIEVPTGEYSYIEPKVLDINVTWQQPVQTSLQGYHVGEIQADPEKYYDYAEGVYPVIYYLAGTFNGGKVVYEVTNIGTIDENIIVYLAKDGEKAVRLYRYEEQFSRPEINAETLLDYKSFNRDKVTVDTASVFKNTLAPETVTIKGQKLSLPKYKNYLSQTDTTEYSNQTGRAQLSNGVIVGGGLVENAVSTPVLTLPEGIVYEVTTSKEGYSLSLFELEMPNSFRVSYEIDGELSNAETQPITWTDGSRNTVQYASFGAGCGGGRYNLVANLTKNDLVQIGKSDGGQPIFMFKDMTQKVAETIRSEVNARGSYDNYIKDTDPPYSAEEFVKDRAVIIVEDGMGRFVIFKNLGNFLQGGCAKPVIYLYPEIPTLLNIQVGADVTISEPFYEPNGWQNVTALPSGQLMYQGRPYDSLFWEGIGHGTYPDKSSYGIVVPRSEAVATMYRQLAEQGFNQKESDDFVEFWAENIPAGDYIRLTWLSTSEMNTLAPLTVSVRPDTVIRTFLEMEGLNSYVELTPQTFRAPARNGFVLTEWGGLAINGLQNLTYPE